MKLLFIGNSATHVHDIPNLLATLTKPLGISLETEMITEDGYELYRHADTESVFEKISRAYDMVFLQEHGNCIASEENAEKSLKAMQKLGNAVQSSGAKLYYYVRPPYGKENRGRDAFMQCKLFDEHFKKSAEQTGAECVFVNRSFAYAIKNCNLRLWGDDNAHASIIGAHLIVFTFFASLFKKSARLLNSEKITEEEAEKLAEIADKIALDGTVPW